METNLFSIFLDFELGKWDAKITNKKIGKDIPTNSSMFEAKVRAPCQSSARKASQVSRLNFKSQVLRTKQAEAIASTSLKGKGKKCFGLAYKGFKSTASIGPYARRRFWHSIFCGLRVKLWPYNSLNLHGECWTVTIQLQDCHLAHAGSLRGPTSSPWLSFPHQLWLDSLLGPDIQVRFQLSIFLWCRDFCEPQCDLRTNAFASGPFS